MVTPKPPPYVVASPTNPDHIETTPSITLVKETCQLFIAKLWCRQQSPPSSSLPPHFSENIVPTSSMFCDAHNDKVVTNDGERPTTKRQNGVGYIVFLLNFFPELCEGKIIKKKDKRMKS
jgi:hypothetical protein